MNRGKKEEKLKKIQDGRLSNMARGQSGRKQKAETPRARVRVTCGGVRWL